MTKALKSAFNVAILKYIGLNYRDYTPSELNKAKKLETWKHYHDKNLENITVINKIQCQIDKWFVAFEEMDNRQINRQFNRINKNYAIIKTNNLISGQSIDKLENILIKIENLSGRNFKR